MSRIRMIRTGLTVDTHGPHGGQDAVEGQTEQRVKEVHDMQNGLDEQSKHGGYGDGHIPVCDTTIHAHQSVICHAVTRHNQLP